MASDKSRELAAIERPAPQRVWPPPATTPENRQKILRAQLGIERTPARSGKDRSVSGKRRKKARRGQ